MAETQAQTMRFPEPGGWFQDLSLPSECIFLPSAKPVPARGVNGISCLSPPPPLPPHRDAPAETQSHPLPMGAGAGGWVSGADRVCRVRFPHTRPPQYPPDRPRCPWASRRHLPLAVWERKNTPRVSKPTPGAERHQVQPSLNHSISPPARPAPRGDAPASPGWSPAWRSRLSPHLQSRCGEGKRGAGRGRQIFLSVNKSQTKP